MKRSGMRWRIASGQAVLTFRALIKSARFDRAWKAIIGATDTPANDNISPRAAAMAIACLNSMNQAEAITAIRDSHPRCTSTKECLCAFLSMSFLRQPNIRSCNSSLVHAPSSPNTSPVTGIQFNMAVPVKKLYSNFVAAVSGWKCSSNRGIVNLKLHRNYVVCHLGMKLNSEPLVSIIHRGRREWLPGTEHDDLSRCLHNIFRIHKVNQWVVRQSFEREMMPSGWG